MSIKSTYQELVASNQLLYDSAQLSAVNALEKLTAELVKKQAEQKSLVSKITHLYKTAPITQGLYFYGRVGRGKTMLLDLFYQHLTIQKKQRIHFHRFMESVHCQLNELSTTATITNKKQANPLKYIAKTWANKVDVLCFDEFFVTDIGDAMLIAGLLEALFTQGITLIATSNCQPEQLYRNGLQRDRFLPTISLINHYCQVLSIDGETDHRMPSCDEELVVSDLDSKKLPYQNYAYPDDQFPQFLSDKFLQLSSQKIKSGTLCINHRDINYLAKAADVIYFDFYALCSGPRSQRDYIRIADQYKTILISRVPQFSGKLIPAVFSGVEDSYQRSGVLMGELRHLDDEARRFIALVDEFYDQGVRLIISAEVDINLLYQGRQLTFEFARCQSRLFEMQKNHYSNQ